MRPASSPVRSPRAAVWVTVAVLLLAAVPAAALINLNYTPVDLVRQSKVILRLEIGPIGEKGEVPAKVVRTLQGQAPEKLVLVLDAVDAAARPDLEAAMAGATAPALLFGGDFSAAAGDAAAGGGAKAVGALHLGRAWFGLFQAPGGALQIGADPVDLRTVWAGDDTMLERAVEYIMADSRADVPVAAGVEWGGDAEVAKLQGKANGLLAVELAGDARTHLVLLSDAGDRVFRPAPDGKTFEEATAGLKLGSKSLHAACADFSGDGRIDLVSWDGERLTQHLMTEGGTFQPRPVQLKVGDGKCLGLEPIDAGAGRQAGLLVSGSAHPSVIVMGPDGTLRVHVIGAGPGDFIGRTMGQAGPCVAADFDGDGVVDVAQPFATGLLFYKGEGPNQFSLPAKACEGRLASRTCVALAGDYDADGLLDLLIGGAEGCFLLRNLGGGQFREVCDSAGEVAYVQKPNLVGAHGFDVNNDGRQEFVLLYPNMGPQPFFNRGFFCFGYATDLELRDSDLDAAQEAMDGQQAGAVADLNGDGAQDLALVTRAAALRAIFRAAEPGAGLGVTVALPAGVAGPVNVVGYDGKRCLGARVVRAARPAFFGKVDKGPMTLEWRAAGTQKQTRRVIVLKPTRVVLPITVPATE